MRMVLEKLFHWDEKHQVAQTLLLTRKIYLAKQSGKIQSFGDLLSVWKHCGRAHTREAKKEPLKYELLNSYYSIKESFHTLRVLHWKRS